MLISKNPVLMVFIIMLGISASLITYQNYKIDSITLKMEAAQVTAKSHVKAYKALQENTARALKEVQIEHVLEIERSKNEASIIGYIENTIPDSDNIVSPVLRNSIERLYDRTEGSGNTESGSSR